jgi:hypothetical protein
MRSLFATVLWGDEYVQNFLGACLPTLLSPGNLGATVRESGFLIITTKEDAQQIRRAPIFTALNRQIEVDFLIVARPRSSDKYFSVSREQTKAIQRSLAFDAIFFVYPDFIFSDGTIERAIKRLDEGHEAVVLPVPRVLDSKVRAEFRCLLATGRHDLILPPREFTALGTRFFHPSMRSYEWGNPELSCYPSTLLWPLAEDTFLFRCFHLHPLAIKVQRNNPIFNTTFRTSLDEEYLPRVFPDIDGIHCVHDSDEGAVCSLSPASFEAYSLPVGQKPDVLFLARWAEGATATLHRQFARKPYRWHTRDIDPSDWKAAEEKSMADIQPVLDRLMIQEQNLRVEDPIAYRRRRQRLQRFSYWSGKAPNVPGAFIEISSGTLLVLIGARLAMATQTYPYARRLWHAIRRFGRKGEGTAEERRSSTLIRGHRMTESVALRALLVELVLRMMPGAVRKSARACGHQSGRL